MKPISDANRRLVLLTFFIVLVLLFLCSENTTLTDSPFIITQDVAKEIVSAVSVMLFMSVIGCSAF